ncbi:MAG: ribose 5-phosphate isomerase B [Atribacterota bacterium]|jgi:ribose 5-phosphate isomerase B|uniref:Putative sugar phosphate isomerase YwlF n=2 Tax=Atribacter TaxID=2847777 RepID=A0A1V5T046_9BACT|nr:ribose 5-phosphate isomerase B [Atribacterota bacterium]OQA60139.1 MAG: putative sugar phosphate isomerase YwlF [Candidatus Atribacteria bacterium ADurb.Bin276]HHT09063.1 ribose 5-phosphate isomerase B [Candidatus Atribacteria bacterium]
MKIALGCDHGGFELKEDLKNFLIEQGYEVIDYGTNSPEMIDYPDIAFPLAKDVAKGKCERGIICCGTGVGVSIAANKVHGIRAANCHDTFSARASREHNNANILTLGGRVIGKGLAQEIVQVWLKSEFIEGRHLRRINKISDYEK